MTTPDDSTQDPATQDVEIETSAHEAATEGKPKKYKEKFKRKSDGELYELVVNLPHPITERTHKATNKIHTWEGTQTDFARDFTRANGDPLLPSI